MALKNPPSGTWNPAIDRYRVTRTFQSFQSGLFGWEAHSLVTDCLQEAMDEIQKPMPRGNYMVEVDEAITEASGKFHWKRLGSRRRSYGKQ